VRPQIPYNVGADQLPADKVINLTCCFACRDAMGIVITWISIKIEHLFFSWLR